MIHRAAQRTARSLAHIGLSRLGAGLRTKWLATETRLRPIITIMARDQHSMGVVEAGVELEATRGVAEEEATKAVARGTRSWGVRNGGRQSMYFPHTIWTN